MNHEMKIKSYIKWTLNMKSSLTDKYPPITHGREVSPVRQDKVPVVFDLVVTRLFQFSQSY